MGLLSEATNEQAFLKAGIFGNAGSGKTTTASYLAMAISKRLGDGKPVAFFETEAGSDFLIERFKGEGIKILRKKSHALADLIGVAQEAEAACSVLVVDSITHVWNEAMEAKLRAVNAGRKKRNLYPIDKLEFQHWADVKREWAKWTTLFLNSRIHIIVCGRAGNIWEYETNEETGKKELQKGGTKMKAEGEFGYEPSLLMEMERVARGNTPGAGWIHRAHILKDRTDTINGMKFDFERPKKGYAVGDWQKTFKPFEPVIKSLNIGGEHRTVDPDASSESLFPGQEGESRGQERAKRVDIALEEIKHSLAVISPGTSDASKVLKATVCEEVLGVRVWSAVEGKKLEDLEIAVSVLRSIEKSFQAEQPEGLDEVRDLAKREYRAAVEKATAKAGTSLENDSLPQ